MEIIKEPLPGCFLLKPRLVEDERGYFYESFNARAFADATGVDRPFLQDNQSYSRYGVIRGLHAQAGSHAQAKLVRVLSGEVLDVVLDLRPESPARGQWFATRLSSDNKHQLYVPRGFAHGFAVLSENAEFFYKCDAYYSKESEYGVNYADPDLGVDWIVPEDAQILTEKDRNLPALKEILNSNYIK